MNSQNHDLIREEGGIQALIEVLRNSSTEVQREAAATLRSLSVNSQNQEVIRQEGGVQVLIKVDGLIQALMKTVSHLGRKVGQKLQLPSRFCPWLEPQPGQELVPEADPQSLKPLPAWTVRKKRRTAETELEPEPEMASTDQGVGQIAQLRLHQWNVAMCVVILTIWIGMCIAIATFRSWRFSMSHEIAQPLLSP